jgi:hypothetical protein
MVADDSMANSRSPVCPDCRSPLPYARINIVNPFDCPSCGKKLCVPPEYSSNIRRVCVILGIALYIIFFVLWKSIFLAFFLAAVAFFIVAMIAQIFLEANFPAGDTRLLHRGGKSTIYRPLTVPGGLPNHSLCEGFGFSRMKQRSLRRDFHPSILESRV